MLRIAFVTPIFPNPREPFRGTYNYKLVESLQKKADVQIFCPTAEPPFPPLQRIQTIDYSTDKLGANSPVLRTTYIPYPSIRFVTRPLNGIVSGRRLRPFLEQHRPDIVFAPWVHPEGYGALRACERLNIPIVIGALGTDLRRVADPISRHLVRETMTRCDAVITVSRELKGWAIGYGADPERVFPVLNGCDANVFFPRDREEMRRKWNIEPDAELALFVGSLLPGKGVRELTEAAAMLFPNRPKLRLAIIGNGPLRERLNQEVAASPYAGRIRVLGPRSAWEIGEWLGAANLLTLPSHSEGCPNVIVEALSSGRPVVATNVGGIPELLNDSNGVMTPPKDPAKLAGALAAALDRNWDEQFIHQTAGRSWDRAAEETLAVCQETYHRATRRKVYSIAGSSEEDPSHMPPLSSRKLRITIVTAFFPSDADPYHGIAVYRTIDELRKFADVRVICPVPASIHKSGASLIPRLMPMSVEPSEVSVKYLPYRTVPLFGRPFNGRSAAAAIARAVEETRPDLILSYWIYPDGYAAVKIAQRLGVPVVLGSRGSDLRCPGSLSMPLTRSAVRHATAVLTVSEDLRRCAIAAGAAPESVTTILNGVNTARFRARNQAACRAALQVAPEKKLILFVGRLSAAKGVRELLAGCAELFPRHPDLELAIIGVGKLLHEVRRFATQHPGRVRVLKTRNRDEVADWMTASDMLCLPSYSEGCPNVVVESLASGRPVVATTVGGIPEILSSDCGVLIAPQSSEEVRRGLDEALRREWNFAHIAEAWSRDWRKVAEETYAVCESLVTKRAAREPEPAAAVAR